MDQENDTVQRLDQMRHLLRENAEGNGSMPGSAGCSRPVQPPTRPISHSKCMHAHMRCVPIACARSS
eukprot:13128523-Heterocapsa_arctica.AAC.1